jgi:hypothetical protein
MRHYEVGYTRGSLRYRQGNKDLLPVKTRLIMYPITTGAFLTSKPLSGDSATQ